jgi:protoporphyrinogen oxidase
MKPHLTILGGGVAGLAAGFYANRHGLPFVIHEAAGRCGGNSSTIRQGDFLFDSGAHRFHDRFPDITRELLEVMGGEMDLIRAPSQIYSQGKLIDFPLKPLDLVLKLGPMDTARAGLGFLAGRLRARHPGSGFEDFAVSRYGRYLAKRFLLDYSQKLWGDHPARLAPEIAGKRLQGLDLRTFFREMFGRRGAATTHLDGAFYYPRSGGIGAIAARLQQRCGENAVRLHSAATRIHHCAGRITAVELNGRERVEVEHVVSSIPLTDLIARLDPPPPAAILQAARQLRFRSLILVAFFLDRPGVTANASLYFPDPIFPFTRIYEPKNRSCFMAPSSRTSLIAEIPCQHADPQWRREDAELLAAARAGLCRSGFLNENEIIDADVVRLDTAYPILDQKAMRERCRVHDYLDRFANLSLTGRNGLFLYTHIHDQLKRGRAIVEKLSPAG